MFSIYRNKADIAPSALVLFIFLAQMTIWLYAESIWALLLASLVFLSFSASPGSISHNHHHTHTFRKPWMNRIYEVMLFFETGVPPYAWTLHHNLGHHKYYLDQSKDPSAWKDRNDKVLSRVRYDIVNALKVYPEIIRIGQLYPGLLKRFYVWSALCLALLTVMLFLKPVATTLLFIIPFTIMLIGLLDNTYSQHSGLDADNHFYASRNTVSRLYNLISWNLGYHTAHHLRPSLHWSQLPEFHDQISKRIPKGLVCDSVFLSQCEGAEYKPAERGQADIHRVPFNNHSNNDAVLSYREGKSKVG